MHLLHGLIGDDSQSSINELEMDLLVREMEVIDLLEDRYLIWLN